MRKIGFAEAFAWRAGSPIQYVACGTTEPLKSQAYDEDGRRENRRVEIIVTESPISGGLPRVIRSAEQEE